MKQDSEKENMRIGSWTFFVFHLFGLLENLLQVITRNSYKENTCYIDITGKSVIANIILKKAKSHSLLTSLFLLKCTYVHVLSYIIFANFPKVVFMLPTTDMKLCAKIRI